MKNSNRTFQQTILSAACAAIFAGLSAPAVFAQDSSGNALLNGSFRFRYVAVVDESQTGAVDAISAEEGVITFLGNGTFTISSGSLYNDPLVNKGAFQSIPTTQGQYAIGPAGTGLMEGPDPDENVPAANLFITYAQGVITGSSTESGVNDFFVAIYAGAIPTNASFTSPYWIGALDYAAGEDVDVKNALFEITPNGAGSLGALTITGQANSDYGVSLTQNVSGATYNFASDGNAQFSIPAPTGVPSSQVLVTGSRTMYVSNDGNFMLGWTPNGYDILFGVKAFPSSVAATDNLYTGLYYQSGMGDQATVGATENCGPFSFWGSLNADGNENEVMHQRVLWPACTPSNTGYPYDLGSWDSTVMSSDGSAVDYPVGDLYFYYGSQYEFGDTGGNCEPSLPNAACAFVAVSNVGGTYGLTIGVHTQPYPATGGVYLSPVGVVNAASWQPITASVAPGELLTLFGSFGSSLPVLVSTGGQPFPNTLGPIQVYIDGFQAPIYYISPTQISVIAPYELASVTDYDEGAEETSSITVEVQVNNGGLLSNEISVYLLTDANSGSYAYGPNGDGNADGFGYASALNQNGVITGNNPALPGNAISMYLGGMGIVTPAITDGAVPPSSPLSYVDEYSAGDLFVYFQDYDNCVFYQPATISSATLAPGYASLYQMNLTVPATVGPGDDIYVEIITPFADGIEVTVPIGGNANPSSNCGSSSSATKAASSFNARPPALAQSVFPRALGLKRPAGQFLGPLPKPQRAQGAKSFHPLVVFPKIGTPPAQ
jgi:uncharacterized protein (TIGR03437 family)